MLRLEKALRQQSLFLAQEGRHHVDESLVQKAVGDAVAKSGLNKRATCHTFRYSFATHLLEGEYDIRAVQEFVGHKACRRNVKTTMIYTHVSTVDRSGFAAPSTRFEVIKESFMLIRIRHCDKDSALTQQPGVSLVMTEAV